MDALTRAAALALTLAACAPDLDDASALVTSPRLLGARAEPAEVAAGERVRVTALVGAPVDGAAPAPRWSLCLARPAPASASPVSETCLGDGVTALGEGTSVELSVPMDACARFGPDPALGQTAARPVDPDATGGYAVPLRARVGDATAFASVRLRCNLAGATREVAADFTRRYRPNANPAVASLSRLRGGVAEDLSDALDLAAGERVTLRVAWPACEGDAPCGGAETYPRFDPVSRALVTQREAMRASWFATAGRFDEPRTGRARDDRATHTDNGWTAPTTPGRVTLWVVLRDERGGAAWRALSVTVR